MSANVVVDLGSSTTKAGICGEERPSLVFPTVFNRRNALSCGIDAARTHNPLSFPISRGLIRDWDAIEFICSHIFSVLGLSPADHCVILADTPSATCPMAQRERLAGILFEQFHVPSLFFQPSVLLSLYATGLSFLHQPTHTPACPHPPKGAYTGLSIDISHGCTSVLPVLEGFKVSDSQRTDLGGEDIDDFLADMLARLGHELRAGADREVLHIIKGMHRAARVKGEREGLPLCSSLDLSSHDPLLY